MASYVLKGVDNELWKRVKKAAIDKDVTIQTYVINLLQENIEKENQK